jgi:serine/threonine-protein kinase
LDRRIHRSVALKVMLQKTMASADLRRRFLREARVQGQLEHPAIVPVHDIGMTADGRPYFTMKRVRGMTLRQVLDALRGGDPTAKQRFGQRKLLTAFATVCQAVDFAHRRGVVHRDLKPENVILGDFGEVYVLDWGIAGLLGAEDERAGEERIEAASEKNLTVPGTMMGTPQYMAPEQLAGRADARSDVYALGLLLYEIATGQRMTAETAESQTAATAAPELLDLARRATNVDPGKRLATARDIHEAVDRFLDGERDEEMRRTRSVECARAAEDAAKRALSEEGSAEDRKTALAEVGRALAFDPENAGAARTLVKLLTEPPRVMPAEAREEWESQAGAARRLAAASAAGIMAGNLLFTPLVLLLGVRSWWAFSVVCAAFLCTVLSAVHAARNWQTNVGILRTLVLGSAAAATLSVAFGPVIVVPGMAAAVAAGFARYGGRRWQLLVGVVANLAVVGPMALAWMGALPLPYVFRDGSMCITPFAFSFPPTSTLVFLLLISVAIVSGTAANAGAHTNALTNAQQRLFVQAWQLRQLVPESAQSTPRASVRAEAAR